MTETQLTVGIIGCGAVTQAIHLPTVLRLDDLWRITHVFDIDGDVASEVARRVGGAAVDEVDDLIADSSIDVIAICSPPQFHAAQVIAACRAGKKAVLCEKPLCVSVEEAHAIADASRATGVPVLTATMHYFDPAFVSGVEAWPGGAPEHIESICLLPFNDLFVNQATQLLSTPAQPRNGSQAAPTRFERFTSGVLGLASHHLPLVRRLMPEIEEVALSDPLLPWGYEIVLSGRSQVTRLFGVMADAPGPSWTFSAASPQARLFIDFPPSYVQAGSSRATLSLASGEIRQWQYPDSGYVREWKILHRLATGHEAGSGYMDDALADFEFVGRILDGYQEVEVSA